MKKFWLSVAILALILAGRATAARAAELSADLAYSYVIDDPEAVNGDILSSGSKGLVRSNVDYDLHMFGVKTETAAIVVRSSDPARLPVVQSGTAMVNVTTNNGPIKKGDYVTSSTVYPGKGQKGSISGYVLGTALEDLEGDKGTIKVAVKIEYAEISNARTLSRLANYLTADIFKNIQDQGQFSMILRYIIAAIIMLISMAVSFITFSRSVPKAIEAVGRNPLAKSTIMLGMALSIVLAIGVIGLGLVASIVILRI